MSAWRRTWVRWTLWLALGAAAAGLLLYAGTVRQTEGAGGPIAGSLRRVGASSDFELRLRNVSGSPVCTAVWPYLYVVRVYDTRGRMLSDQPAWDALAEPEGPDASTFVALQPGEEVMVRLAAYNARGQIALGQNADTADCVSRTTEEGALTAPEWVRSRGVPVYIVSGAPRIGL